jgi:hypothetical protein
MTTTEKLKITMSERRPMSIVKSDWPVIAKGSAYSGQYEFQAFDGARVCVRRHADGRMIVYGYAGDWDGGGRPTRENREAGFLIAAGATDCVFQDSDGAWWLPRARAMHREGQDSEEVVRAIRRVAGILAETECVGDMADEAARACIANLPAEDDAAEEPSIAIPLSGAKRLLRTIEDVANSGGSGVDPRYAKDLQAVASELRAVIALKE